jgi:hypothetical protein
MEELINGAMGFFSRVATPAWCKSLVNSDLTIRKRLPITPEKREELASKLKASQTKF